MYSVRGTHGNSTELDKGSLKSFLHDRDKPGRGRWSCQPVRQLSSYERVHEGTSIRTVHNFNM